MSSWTIIEYVHRPVVWLCLVVLTQFGCANLQQAERSGVDDLIVGEPGNFHGYQMYSFNFNDRTCRVVAPRKPADGAPWIWRSHFFGHRPEVDLALLSKGFYLAYIDVSDLYGNAEAVEIWNDYYHYLTNEYQFAEKVVLEGVSVGGLVAFNWAVTNADKIVCIYADAPVLDIRSWPGGFQKGRGSPDDWQKSLKVYQLSEQQALQYKEQPYMHLEALAKQQVPILILSGDADDVVPYEENAGILAEKYRALDGEVKVIMKRETGHTHGLDDAQPIVNFILRHIRREF